MCGIVGYVGGRDAVPIILDGLRRLVYTLVGRFSLDEGEILLDERGSGAEALGKASRVVFLACGTSWHAALIGKFLVEELVGLPAEVDYHTEGYPAGEMKHEPIALVDDGLPLVALCPRGRVYEKMLSRVQEVKARGGRVVAVASAGATELHSLLDGPGDALLEVPECAGLWSPFLTVVPLQLLAYHLALRAGRVVDQPRNLAKSVTVE